MSVCGREYRSEVSADVQLRRSDKRERMIRDLLPSHVVVMETVTPALWDHQLDPLEADALGSVAPKRRAEYAAGRSLARRGLIALGVNPEPVGRGPRHEPVWPDGVVGSITHCDGYCGVALARTRYTAGIGIDAESRIALSPELVTSICTARERAGFPRHGSVDWPTVAFSAKEAIFKLWFPATRARLAFHDVEVEFDIAHEAFRAELTRDSPFDLPLEGRFSVRPGLVLTAVHVS